MQHSITPLVNSAFFDDLLNTCQRISWEQILYGIFNNGYDLNDVKRLTCRVRAYHENLNLERVTFDEYCSNFNSQYANEDNGYFNTFNEKYKAFRTSIASAMLVFRKFCKIDRRRAPIINGREVQMYAYKNSMLGQKWTQTELFGLNDYSTEIQDLCGALVAFFEDFTLAIKLCREVIRKERNLRKDDATCKVIHDRQYQNILNQIGLFIDKNENIKPSEMVKCLLPIKENCYAENFHCFNENEMRYYVYYTECERLARNGLTLEEVELFGNNKDKIEEYRYIAANFDKFEPKGKLNKATGKHKIKGVYVAMFMEWCKPNNKKLFCKWFFSHYNGSYEEIKYGGIHSASVDQLYNNGSYPAFNQKLKEILAKKKTNNIDTQFMQTAGFPSLAAI